MHRAICEFRHRHLENFRKLFVEVVGLARELALAMFGTLSTDGTKVRANASKRKEMTYRRMKREQRRLEAEVRDWLRRADEIDAEEDARYGKNRRGGRGYGRVAESEESPGGESGGPEAAGGGATSSVSRAGDKRTYGEPDPKA